MPGAASSLLRIDAAGGGRKHSANVSPPVSGTTLLAAWPFPPGPGRAPTCGRSGHDAHMGSRRAWRGAPGRLSGRLPRWLVLAAALVCGCAAGMAGAAPGGALARPAVSSARSLLDSAARSMIRHHIRGPRTGIGWAWSSAIQAPQVNTDRDVGASSVGVGFLAAYQTTGERAYLHAAEEAADWLVSIAEPDTRGTALAQQRVGYRHRSHELYLVRRRGDGHRRFLVPRLRT